MQCSLLFTIIAVVILCNNAKTTEASFVDTLRETWNDFTNSDMVRKAQKVNILIICSST